MDRKEMKKEMIKWFCEAKRENGIFEVSNLYAFLYYEIKKNLGYWASKYKEDESESKAACLEFFEEDK